MNKGLSLSFITVIKDRTNINVEYNNKIINLKLFENNLRALIDLIEPEDDWEYIIVDYESKDVNMADFISSLPKKPNLNFVIYTQTGNFDRGGGLNFGLSKATKENTFCLDSDMLINTRELFNDINTYVVEQKKVLFPICYSYNEPEHLTGFKRDTGLGMVVQKRSTVIKYVNNKTWGHEDLKNYNYYNSKNQAIRTYYGTNYVHQWHPEELKHINYK